MGRRFDLILFFFKVRMLVLTIPFSYHQHVRKRRVATLYTNIMCFIITSCLFKLRRFSLALAAISNRDQHSTHMIARLGQSQLVTSISVCHTALHDDY